MHPGLILLFEIAGFSALVCALHGYRHRLGPAALYATFGVFACLLFTVEISVRVQLFGATPSQISSLLYVPVMLVTIVLTYVLDGTVATRRFLGGVIVVYLVQIASYELVAFHIHNPPAGLPVTSTSTVLLQNPLDILASLVALLVDGVVVVLVYQFLRNRMPAVWLPVPLYLGLVVAMGVDGWVYTGLHGIAPSWDGFRLPEKLQAGLAAGLPMAVYIRWQLGANPDLGARGTLDIIDLRLRLSELERSNTRLRRLFSRYVSPAVVDSLVQQPDTVHLGGEEREVTVLFSDLRGFSSLGEALSPMELVGLVNRYLKAACPPILDAGGMINEVEGDGILAIFGAPVPSDDHAQMAIRAGRQIRDAVARLDTSIRGQGSDNLLERAGLDALKVRIGIHTGRVVLGHIGTDRRSKYAAIGDAVNTAARIEALNKTYGTTMLISERTRAHAEVAEAGLDDHGEVTLRGRKQPVRLWSVS